MTTKRIQTAGECVVAQFLPSNASTVRDAFVKTIYDHLFRWIVEKINEAIYKSPFKEGNRVGDRHTSEHWGSSSGSSSSGFFTRSNTWPNSPNSQPSPTTSNITSNTGFSSTESGVDFYPNTHSSAAGNGRLSIGVLDIFGFENFSSNRYIFSSYYRYLDF